MDAAPADTLLLAIAIHLSSLSPLLQGSGRLEVDVMRRCRWGIRRRQGWEKRRRAAAGPQERRRREDEKSRVLSSSFFTAGTWKDLVVKEISKIFRRSRI